MLSGYRIMEPIINTVIIIVSFLLTVLGAWDRLITIFNFYKLKRNERRVRKAKKVLENIELLNTNPSYLIAYLLKQLFYIVSIVLIALLTGLITPQAEPYELDQLIYLSGLLSAISGFFAGNAFHAMELVLKAEKLTLKYEAIVKEYE